jgi:3-hydroxy-3-methylglutaryl CoA synthase
MCLAGIIKFGAYIPKYRLGPKTVGWNSSSERAVANFDEDSITMAVAAGFDCINNIDRNKIDGVIFASTTSPYAEKQSASIVAEALDLRQNLFTIDMAGALKCGVSALRSALDSVIAGSCRLVLVLVSDSRQASPRSDVERNSGDGAVAFLIGTEDVIAECDGFYAFSQNILDNWRSSNDPFVNTWEDRFSTEEGLDRVLQYSVDGFLDKYQLKPSDIDKIALYAPDYRRHSSLAKRLGFEPSQIEDPMFDVLGNTGAAFALMILAKTLEACSAGQRIVVAAYGDGSDILGFKVTGTALDKGSSLLVTGHLSSKHLLEDYETYAKWRDVWEMDDGSRRPSANSPSATALWRENEKNIRLYGSKCTSCDYIQYPAQKVCVNCQAITGGSNIRLSDKQGSIFTYSMDYIAGTVDVPLVITVVNFDCGGRLLCMMTDREVDKVCIGMTIEMSFRKLRVVNGIHNYYWKSIPKRGLSYERY